MKIYIGNYRKIRRIHLMKIIEKYEEYIELLGEEIKELAGFAFTHGWESSRVEKGQNLRQEINELKKEFKK